MTSLGGPNWVTQTSCLDSELCATTAQKTVVLRKDRVLWLLVLERVVFG